MKSGVTITTLEKLIIDLKNDKFLTEANFHDVTDKFFGYNLIEVSQFDYIEDNDGVEIGSPVKPMMARSILGSLEVWELLVKNKETLVYCETKFDGERVQVHWNSAAKKINFFSRSMDNCNAKYEN